MVPSGQRSPALEIDDAQLHVWDRDRPDRPWAPGPGTGGDAESVTRRRMQSRPFPYEELVHHMAGAGVGRALLVTPAMYGSDNRYALDAAAALPERFAVVGRIDHRAPDVGARVGEWKRTPGAAAIRVTLYSDQHLGDWRDARYDGLLAAVAEHDVPLCIYPPALLSEIPALLSRFPAMRLAIDHLGLSPAGAGDPAEARSLDGLLALSRFPNVAVRATHLPAGAVGLRLVERVISTFGASRVMWGSDWSAPQIQGTYGEAVSAVRRLEGLSHAERQAVAATTLRTFFGWRP
jgi:predicted TIM-barrel fold metal-dependent hydrolase